MPDAEPTKLKYYAGRLQCLLGFHHFQVIEVTFTFGEIGNIEKLQCQRCKRVVTRQAK
ncbi:MAG: hypothetical protein K9K86_05455 [Pseudomonadales bacterium]|nr:hypothetical protein [Pseudomonadales bacterium]